MQLGQKTLEPILGQSNYGTTRIEFCQKKIEFCLIQFHWQNTYFHQSSQVSVVEVSLPHWTMMNTTPILDFKWIHNFKAISTVN